MKKGHKGHIKKEERMEISFFLEKGYGVSRIASLLQRSKSSISDEIKRNSVNKEYDPKKAHHKAYVRRKYSRYQGMRIVQDHVLRRYVETRLLWGWTPEMISGRIKEVDVHIPSVGKDAIYKFRGSVYGKILGLKKKSKKKGKRGRKRTSIDGRRFIGERPGTIGKREEYGHLEGDFIVSPRSGKGSLAVSREMRSRLVSIEKLKTRKVKEVNDAFVSMAGRLVDLKSITLDNDVSFAGHRELSKRMDVDVWFCDPYSSWQKGGVENANMVIRRFIPKGTDISKVPSRYIKEIERKINDIPLKCLGYHTPFEVASREGILKS
jgi:transposase, IS30 family